MVLTCLYLTAFSLPIEQLYEHYAAGYDVWLVNDTLHRQLKNVWPILCEQPQAEGFKVPKLFVVPM